MSANAQQQRGQRKSPFIGRRTPLVEDGNPLLYPRYTHVSEILLDSKSAKQQVSRAITAAVTTAKAASGAAAAVQPVNGAKQRPTAREALLARAHTAQQRAGQAAQPSSAAAALPAATAEAPSPDAAERRRQERKLKKEMRKQKRAAEAAAGGAAEAAGGQATADDAAPPQKKKAKTAASMAEGTKVVSGPGNADEAASIRAALGFGPPATAAAPALVPAPGAAATGNFSFGFQPAPAAVAAAESSSSEESDEDVTAPVQPPQPSGNAIAERQPGSAVPRPMPAGLKPAQPPSAPAEEGQGYVPNRVFVGGMPFSYEEEEVREYWGFCGTIADLQLMRFPDTGRFKGMAFITYAEAAGYEAALACDGSELEGKTLRVDRCKAPRAAKPEVASTPKAHAAAEPQKVPGYYVAYCGNIAFEATAAELEEVFADCAVTQVRLHTDKETGRSKGYAHVHFPDEASLEKAVAKNGMDFYGRNLKIGFAQKKRT